ncbi:MAG: putative Ig domain-containing protein [Desulfuromonadaceae bacterium]|nr:putative Ig domain-containing protein [Desulfuromonadaceae bacterium]
MKKVKICSLFLFLAFISMVIIGCGSDSHPSSPPGVLAVTTASLPGATVGTSYSQALAASGGTTPYTWSISAGNLPAGLSLNTSSGVISGTPTTAATATNFTVMVTDSATSAGTATKVLSITVIASGTPLSITTTSPLAAGMVGTAYGPVILAANGGTGPYTWTVTSGSALPTGLTLSTAGVISGTPSASGTTVVNITVTDANAGMVTKALSISVAVTGTPLSISTTSPLTDGAVGAAYGPVTMVATGGTTPYTWTVAAGSALPAGLLLSTGGVISGTPTTSGTVSTNITVTDVAAGTVTNAFSITVVAPHALNILTPSCTSACHSLPPTTVPNVAGSPTTMPHTTNTKCGVCHVIGGWVPGTTTFNMSGVATHNNGTINILAGLPTASCVACHALPPVSAIHPAVAVKAYVANCGICHPVGPGNPITMGISTHNNGTINFNP